MFILCGGSRISQASDLSSRTVDSEVMKVCGVHTIGVLLVFLALRGRGLCVREQIFGQGLCFFLSSASGSYRREWGKQ